MRGAIPANRMEFRGREAAPTALVSAVEIGQTLLFKPPLSD